MIIYRLFECCINKSECYLADSNSKCIILFYPARDEVMTETYQQLTYEQRCQISALKKRGCSQREIAETVGTSQSTVSRELARNTGNRGYRHRQAQEMLEGSGSLWSRPQVSTRCARVLAIPSKWLDRRRRGQIELIADCW